MYFKLEEGKEMQVQRISAINSNPANNSNKKVNFKAVSLEGEQIFYDKGVTPTQVVKAARKLFEIYREKNIALFAEGDIFGVRAAGSKSKLMSRSFDAQTNKNFVNQVLDVIVD